MLKLIFITKVIKISVEHLGRKVGSLQEESTPLQNMNEEVVSSDVEDMTVAKGSIEKVVKVFHIRFFGVL